MMRKHLLAAVLILTGTTGCDNVAWGGIDVQLRSPGAPQQADPVAGDVVSEPDSVAKVPGPVLLAGRRVGDRAELVVVGEVLSDGLSRFPDPRYPRDASRLARLAEPGSEWVLFSEGVRVGRMIADTSGTAEEFCGAGPRISGVVELIPTAAAVERLLAFPAADADGRAAEPYAPFDPYREHAHTYDQRVASLSIAGEAIARYGEPWPPGGVLGLRAHIQAFQLSDAERPWIAATFVSQDRLGIVSPRPGAYALFVMGRPVEGEYVETFTWYRSVEAEGKGVPRYHDHLDWDGDGADEILLDVFGAERRWFVGLDRQSGMWVRAYEDPCASDPAASG
ncbi:MAG: hypothetical protein R3304_01445 [Longimicrobiales bacterium]|nr:hypothetical protein [Longimicrobiales bacterium]